MIEGVGDMKHVNRSGAFAALLSISSILGGAAPVQAYPVDCAILLCLAGSWPASAECAQAYTVFIARITPWPIEPPLQIWNCPMQAGFRSTKRPMDRLFEAGFPADEPAPLIAVPEPAAGPLRVQESADVDISDPAFDFVRSIRVFEIAYQRIRDSDGDCDSWATIVLGSYGEQGEYSRRPSSVAEIPSASVFELPASCSTYRHRSVFVDWRDYEGTYGFEEVHY
jgi:hypothetical protein